MNGEIIQERDGFPTFYYRIPDGESGVDVYDRMSSFLETPASRFSEIRLPGQCASLYSRRDPAFISHEMVSLE